MDSILDYWTDTAQTVYQGRQGLDGLLSKAFLLCSSRRISKQHSLLHDVGLSGFKCLQILPQEEKRGERVFFMFPSDRNLKKKKKKDIWENGEEVTPPTICIICLTICD